MIGTHDSFSYLPAQGIANLLPRLWRTQSASLLEQYASGVRMFDLRIRLDRTNTKWQACHGLARFNWHWDRVADLCRYIEKHFPKAIYRIVLDRGNRDEEDYFRYQSEHLCEHFSRLWRVDIRRSGRWDGAVCNNNAELYKEGYLFAMVNTWECPAFELHGKLTWRNALTLDLHKEARRINATLPVMTDDEAYAEDTMNKENLFLLDYATEILDNGITKRND